jgi:hypothetical protein
LQVIFNYTSIALDFIAKFLTGLSGVLADDKHKMRLNRAKFTNLYFLPGPRLGTY